MPQHPRRSERIAEIVQRIVGELLVTSVKDPRLQMVTITGAKASADSQHVTLYFSLTGDENRRKEAMAAFKAATGFFRSHLRQETEFRVVPELRFQYDQSLDEGEKIDRLLREVTRHDQH